MAFKHTTLKDMKPMPKIIADRRLWLSEDGVTVLEDGDPDARFLLCAAGTHIPDSDAERLGLSLTKAGKLKAVKKSEDKAARKGEDKGA